MLDNVIQYISFLNARLIGPLSSLVLLGAGIYLSVKLRFFHLKNPIKLWKMITRKRPAGGVSPFRALTVALAGTLGVGNISGVAVALAMGGAGAVFWMWISAICAMIVKYAEIVLAVHHRSEESGQLHGGAMYYIKRGLKKKGVASTLAIGFAVFCLFSSLSTGSIIQVNAASEALYDCFSFDNLYTGILMAILAGIALFGHNSKQISDITVRIVPLMSAVFIAMSIIIIFSNIGLLPKVLNSVLKGAFTPDSAIGGIGGFLFSRSVRYGVTKGLFSNEAGCGTSTIAHASAQAYSPSAQGIWGIFEVFFDTIILCSLTAGVLLVSYGSNIPSDGGGVKVVLDAYSSQLGIGAKYILALAIFLFAYATIICWAYYGCECLIFLNIQKFGRRLYLAIYILSIVYGAVASPSLIWEIADLSICVMMTVNTSCVCMMSDTVFKLSSDAIGRNKKTLSACSHSTAR